MTNTMTTGRTGTKRAVGLAAFAGVAAGLFLPMMGLDQAHAERVDLTSKYGYTSDDGIFNILGGYDKPKQMKGDTDLAFCIEMGVYFPSGTTKVIDQATTDEYPEIAYVINKWGDKKDDKNQAAVQYLVHKNLDVHDKDFKSEHDIKPGDSDRTDKEYEKARDAMLKGIDPEVKTLADKYWDEASKNVGPYTAGNIKITPDTKNSGTGTLTGFSLSNEKGTELDDQKVTVKIDGDATFEDGKKSKTLTVKEAAAGLDYQMTKADGKFKVSYSTDDLPTNKLVIAQLGKHDGGDGYDGTGTYPKGNPDAGEKKTDRTGDPTQTSISALSGEAGAESKVATYEQGGDLKTTATDKADGDKNVTQKGGVVKDTVHYDGLIGGKKYTMNGELQDKETKKPLGVSAKKEFTADKSGKGTVELEFKLPDSAAGKTAVAFETAKGDNGDVIVHADIDDEDQTVYIADAQTKAKDKADGDKNLAQKGGTITDTIDHHNFTAGEKYIAEGELMDAETGKSLGITAKKNFTAKKSDGSVDVDFEDLPAKVAGKKVVVFESIKDSKGKVVAEHKDLKDEGQTVVVADVHTSAADKSDGDKKLVHDGTIVDHVKYENLVPGKEYTVKGELMSKKTGKSTGVTQDKTFTPKKANGTVDVTFDLKDAKDFAGGKTVVFETLYDAKGKVVAEHKDLDDKGQTVDVEVPPETPPSTPDKPDTPDTPEQPDQNSGADVSTGGQVADTDVNPGLLALGGLGAAAALAGAGGIVYKVRKGRVLSSTGEDVED